MCYSTFLSGNAHELLPLGLSDVFFLMYVISGRRALNVVGARVQYRREKYNLPWEERENNVASDHGDGDNVNISGSFPRWSFLFMVMVGHFVFHY